MRLEETVDLSESDVRELDLLVIGGFAKAVVTPPIKLQTLVLSEKSISPAGLKAVAPIVSRLEVTGAMEEQKMRSLGDALLACSTGRLGSLKCSAFEVPKGATACDLSREEIKPGAAALLAGVLKFNAVLTDLK